MVQKDQNRNEWKMPLVTAESECRTNKKTLIEKEKASEGDSMK
jgi:hypothetical protein